MEFLRFGSSIPGSYWGCCAVCIIQNFKVDPDSPASIQLVNGDVGYPLTDDNDQFIFAGPTYKDIFLQRLRIGTFSNSDMPNHAFLAVLTEQQIQGGVGKKWLKLLKEQGFEFIRTVDNSVYTGEKLVDEKRRAPHKNYLFGLFRNVGSGAVDDPFTPPSEWTELPKVVPEAWELLSATAKLTEEQQQAQLKLYKELPPKKWMTLDELEKTNTPVTMAGERSKYPQESKANRDLKKKQEKGVRGAVKSPQSAPFA